jgi:hypothetical protein
MKTPILKLLVVTSLLTLAGAVVVPTAQAADDKKEAMAARKAQREAEMLKKYDTNQDGKLDDAEKTVRKADRDKAKAERAAKKHDKAENAAEPETK